LNRVVVVALAVVVVGSAVLAQPAPSSSGSTITLKEGTETLARMRAELERKQAALDGLSTAETSLVESLGALDETLAGLADARQQAATQLAKLQAERFALERDAGLDEEELARLRQRLRRRLMTLAVEGEGQAARALLGAESFTDLALRRHLLARIADTDARLVQDVKRVEASALGKRAALIERAREAEELGRLLTAQEALLSATREERGATLERIRGERAILKAAQAELVARHRDLQFVVAKLAEGPRYQPPTGKSGVLRQGLAFPVDGGVVIRRFGSVIDPVTKAEIVSNGLELRADAGAHVVAVAHGRVVHSGWLRGFGRIVIVDHGEGHHTLSAHLSQVTVGRGDEVQRGQTIGLVGDTESQNGPKLYFELRENSRPRDPLPFLRR
jgi:septal ring factor EnvC (AmiA/AmiB activator)